MWDKHALEHSAPAAPLGIDKVLGTDAAALAAKSPSLTKDLKALEADGWKIQYGPAGGGTFCDKAAKTAAVEQALGARLTTADGSAAFAFYGAKGVRVGDVTLAVDYREPRRGGDATAGPLLNLHVAGGCPARAEVEKRFGPLAVAGAPTGRSPAEETKFARDEPWGRLIFGYAERAPDCLSSITFQAR